MSDSESEVKSQSEYAIVWFETEKKTELVPLSWVYHEEGQEFCFYPPRKDYRHIDHWLTSCAKPKDHWDSFLAETLSRTISLEKGKERLERSYRTRDIDSTDGEMSSKPSKTNQKTPAVLSEKMVKKSLKDVPSMFGEKTKKLKNVSPMPTVPEQHERSADLKTSLNHVNKGDAVATGSREGSPNGQVNTIEPAMKKYIDEKFDELHAELTSLKRSLMYDFNAKILEIKNTIIASAATAKTQSTNMSEAKAGVGVILPIDDLQMFIEFNESLAGNNDQKNALMALYRVLVCGKMIAKNCIATIMQATVTKNVEVDYSGTGRKVHGVGKADFSKTAVFGCIQDVLLEKFGDDKEVEGLAGKIGKWLSGAADRAGGRKERAK